MNVHYVELYEETVLVQVFNFCAVFADICLGWEFLKRNMNDYNPRISTQKLLSFHFNSEKRGLFCLALDPPISAPTDILVYFSICFYPLEH